MFQFRQRFFPALLIFAGFLSFCPLEDLHAEILHQIRMPLQDGSSYDFWIHSESELSEIHYYPTKGGTPRFVRRGKLSWIPILKQDLVKLETSELSFGGIHTSVPNHAWLKINDQWHFLRYGLALPLNVPDDAALSDTLFTKQSLKDWMRSIHWTGTSSEFLKLIWGDSPYLVAIEAYCALFIQLPFFEFWKIFLPRYLAFRSLLYSVKNFHISTYQKPKFRYATPFIHEGTAYFIYQFQSPMTQQSGTVLTRLQDAKSIRLSSKELDETLHFRLEDRGIISTSASPRKISLPHFDMEALYLPSPTTELLKDSNGAVQDPVAIVQSLFSDPRTDQTPLPPSHARSQDGIFDQLKEIYSSNGHKKAAVLLAPSGTGKTTLARQFFREIPPTWHVFRVTPTQLHVSAVWVGLFEYRVQAMLLASKTVPIIWFFDEMHHLKSGRTMHSDRFFDLIKSSLGSGDLLVLGTDTQEDYLESFSRDPSISSHFHPVYLPERSAEDIQDTVSQWLSMHHFPELDDAVYFRARTLVESLGPQEAEPKRTLSLIERAFSLREKTLSKAQPLSIADIERAATAVYRIEPASLQQKDATKRRLTQLKETLDQRVIGLEHAKEKLISLTKRALLGLHDNKGPRINTLLFGPPGTGKTELALAYAEGMELPALRIEMNRARFAQREVSIQIADALRKHPFSVIILDEIEKAPPALINTLLALFDQGIFNVETFGSHMEQPRTQAVSARNATFILTSNGGSEWIQRQVRFVKDFKPGQLQPSEVREIKQALLEEGVPVPFLDRLQQIIPILPPSQDQFKQIIAHHMDAQLNRIASQQTIRVTVANRELFLTQLTQKYFRADVSNREVVKLIQRFIDEGLSNALLHPEYSVDKEIELQCTWPDKEPPSACKFELK